MIETFHFYFTPQQRIPTPLKKLFLLSSYFLNGKAGLPTCEKAEICSDFNTTVITHKQVYSTGLQLSSGQRSRRGELPEIQTSI